MVSLIVKALKKHIQQSTYGVTAKGPARYAGLLPRARNLLFWQNPACRSGLLPLLLLSSYLLEFLLQFLELLVAKVFQIN